ncbi:hypothetical protein ACQPWY_26830 [Pseudonocardia xinjiangensis]|uniref:hypothetical protein n=1 Tax=Pseudonocardia xinjiangensis TaxID=75289 RepID=UPI003D8A0257
MSELAAHDVDWVLSGSAVLVLYGATITPNDLDVVPRLDQVNLGRLARMLDELGAVPAHFPTWPESLSREQCLAWSPDPSDPTCFDHLFVTSLGLLDLPPSLTGTFEALRRESVAVDIAGIPVQVCNPHEVLDRLDGRRRAKDVERTAQYDLVRHHLHLGEPPVGTRL